MAPAEAIDLLYGRRLTVAMVAAESRAQAEDGAEAIDVFYDPLPAVTSIANASAPGAPLIYEELGTNVPWQGHVAFGDVEGAFARADRVVREQLKIHRYSSTPLEPFAMIAEYTHERLTIWCNAQNPETVYEALTEALGLENIRVIVPDIGGGFGQKIHLIRKYAVLTALMAMQTGRPVKWIENRNEHMMAGGHSCDQEFDVEAAVTHDGEVLGLIIRDSDDVGGSISTLTIHFTNKLNNLFNTYRVQHLRLEGRSVITNKCPVVPNRGIGKPGMCFIWERMMDRIADALGLDPIAVRRRNLLTPDQFPYTTPNGNIYGSGDYPVMLDKVLKNIDYEGVRRRQATGSTKGRLLGIGIASFTEVVGAGKGAEYDIAGLRMFDSAELRVHPTLVPAKRLISSVEGAMNAVVVQGDAVGTTMYYGKGAGSEPTASAVVADLVDITRLATADPDHRVPSLAFQPDALADDVRFKSHGLAPKSAADFAFLLHGFHFLKDEGVMAIILPHGVLFRGGAEERIRTKLLKDGHIDTVIGLPSNLFYSTGIPVCILVLKKCKKPDDVLFINAAEYFEKGKRQNFLRQSRGIWKFSAKASVDGQLAVEAELMCTMRSISEPPAAN